MPISIIYLLVMLTVIIVWSAVIKRPVYEAVFLALIVLFTISKSWDKFFQYCLDGINSPLIFSMIVFIAMSQFLKATGILDDCINCILALFGRIPGGAGYVSIAASVFMGAFSGSGPGNVMAVGTITIPAMKRSGFPSELAANIQASSSCLGNMIPPSSNILLALGCFLAVYPNSNLTTGQFWIIMWGLSFWFILARIIMTFIYCRIYKIKGLKKEELPNLKETFKNGWKGLLLPVIILFPFILDFAFGSTFFTSRLGANGAKFFSNSILLFTAGLASFYAILVSKNKDVKNIFYIKNIFKKALNGLVPTVATVIFGYIIGALFSGLGVAGELEGFINELNMNKYLMALFISILTCVLGMVIPGSSLVAMFGTVFVVVMAASGINPLIAAAMLPCICGAMGNITPPFALCVYASMGIAESDYGKTIKMDLVWVAAQLLMQIIVLVGFLPIIGV